MAEGIEKILECPICLEQIKNPKMLPCQHSFCLKNCLENLVDGSSSTKNPVLICPLCREIFDVPINGVSGFPNNYILQNLLEKQIDTITQNQTKIIRMSKVPEGWEERESRSTGQSYYINKYTKQSQWETPKEPAKPASEDDKVPNKVPNNNSVPNIPNTDGQCRNICIFICIIILISTISGIFKALFKYLLS